MNFDISFIKATNDINIIALLVYIMTVDIVNLIELNPIINLNGNYQSKIVEKVKNNFSTYEQQMFVASFYCYLNYNKKTDFVIDLDTVWKWLGFASKFTAKRLLEKHFVIDNNYKKLASHLGEAKINDEYVAFPIGKASLCDKNPMTNKTHGGQNKEIIMLNIETFKKFCMKAGTKKADEIHDYYLKLEEILHEYHQVGQFDGESNLVKTFACKYECIKHLKISDKTLAKCLTKNIQYNGFYFKEIESKLNY